MKKAFLRGFEKKAESPSSHTCTSKAGIKYSVPSLWKAAVGLPVEKVKTDKLAHLLKNRMWKDYEGEKTLALKSQDPWHLKKTEKASLRYPILVHPSGWVMDGAHRLVKAMRHGAKEVRVIRFPKDPAEARLEKKASSIQFPEDEKEALLVRLKAGKSIFTSRMSAEKGKYREGETLESPLGPLMVKGVRSFKDVKEHPFLSELTEDQRRQLRGHPFDLVELGKKDRVEAADLSYPVLTRLVNRGQRELIDGSHRVEKAKQTGQSVKEIVVPKSLLSQATARREIEGKQYAAIGGRMIDVEKLWKMTKGMKENPLDTSKIQWREKKAEHPEIVPSDPDKPARMGRMSMLIRPSGKGRVMFNRDLEEEGASFVSYENLAERELMGIFGFTQSQAHALVSRLHRKARLKEAGHEGNGV